MKTLLSNCVRMTKKAFTLIELLLGIGIFALIALTFYGIFSNGLKINSKAEQIEQLSRELRWSLDSLTLDLENMVSYEGYSGGSGVFEGKPQSLSLALPTESGLKIIRYSLQPPEMEKIFETRIEEHTTKNKQIIVSYDAKDQIEFLVREILPFFSSTETAEARGEPEVLSTHIQPDSLHFKYGYQEKKGDKETTFNWKDEWKDAHFPAAVKVELSFMDPTQSDVPLTVEKNIFIPAGSWGNVPPPTP